MIIDGINFKELNITKDGELIASITDGKDGIVHKDGYRVQLVVEDVGMSFAEAFKRMKAGRKVKLPSWGGYWYWDTEKETIMMQCRDKDNGEKGDLLDIRDTQMVEYTLNNILSNEWIIADEANCPVLGGEATFSFGDAIKYMKRGLRVARKGWNGKGMYVFYASDFQFGTKADLSEFNPTEDPECTEENKVYVYDCLVLRTADKKLQPGWLASQSDMLAEDWMFVE